MKAVALLVASAALLLGGCASADAGDDPRMPVTAAFYPLQFVAERVGGEHVRVTSLTKPGVEPHDLELTPRAVGSLADAAAVVYLAGFQPAVDQAVRSQAADAALDVTPAARLTLTTAAGHADPHFWLDPTRLADVAEAVADDLAVATRPTPPTTAPTRRTSSPTSTPSTPSTAPASRGAAPVSSSPGTRPSATWPTATTCTRRASPASAPTSSPTPPRCAT